MRSSKNVGSLTVGAVLVTVFFAAVPAAGEAIVCTPSEVATLFNERVHVKCAEGAEGIVFFAVPMSNSDLANQVLSLGATAIVHGKKLRIQYEKADNSGTAYGCASKDCRPLLGLQLLK